MTVESNRPLFSLEDFRATREALREKIDVTPLQRSDSLSELTGAEVYLKLESFQRTNSFKVRGAYGALLARLEEARQRGVVTGSSGNFAQGLAYAGHELDVPVTVVMLERSAPNKVEAARQWGAEIVFCDNEFALRNATKQLTGFSGSRENSSYTPMTTKGLSAGTAPWDWSCWSSYPMWTPYWRRPVAGGFFPA
jgi:threonine dehydratase